MRVLTENIKSISVQPLAGDRRSLTKIATHTLQCLQSEAKNNKVHQRSFIWATSFELDN